jgi:hypothetical protein
MATDDLKAVIRKARQSAIRLQAEQIKDRAQYTADIDQAIADDVTAYFAATLEAQLAARDAEIAARLRKNSRTFDGCAERSEYADGRDAAHADWLKLVTAIETGAYKDRA